jgi:hypothetical protein
VRQSLRGASATCQRNEVEMIYALCSAFVDEIATAGDARIGLQTMLVCALRTRSLRPSVSYGAL